MNAIRIDHKDIGRKVINVKGEVLTIARIHDERRCSVHEEMFTYYRDGTCPGVPSENIVRFKDEPTLHLQAGKYYWTRDGRKAYITAVIDNPFGKSECDDYPARGFIDASTVFRGWRLGGQWIGGEETPNDLVAEWVEPKRIKGWLNVYADRLFEKEVNTRPCDGYAGQGIHADRSRADDGAQRAAKKFGAKRIACIEIDMLEGQGLKGEAGR